MTDIESAWGRFPGYQIDLLPWRGLGRVRLGERVLGESDACLIVLESDHEAQLYFPEACIAWEHFEATDHHTVCPFKGEADYWTLTASDPPRENVAWTYRTPFEEVAGHVAFGARGAAGCGAIPASSARPRRDSWRRSPGTTRREAAPSHPPSRAPGPGIGEKAFRLDPLLARGARRLPVFCIDSMFAVDAISGFRPLARPGSPS
jgi:uncharacterized protein (DUF427 family)